MNIINDKLILFFHANWCSHCVNMEPIVEEFVKKYNIMLKKIDTDKNPEETKSHNINGIPVVIYYKSGKEVSRVVGETEDLEKELNYV